jgi:hypothetical protein
MAVKNIHAETTSSNRTDTNSPDQPRDEQKRQAPKKEDNPFSEQEKYGEQAQGRKPQSEPGDIRNPSVQRHGLGVEDDTGDS